MEPLAGAAPAQSPYKGDVQAAAERQEMVARQGNAPCSTD